MRSTVQPTWPNDRPGGLPIIDALPEGPRARLSERIAHLELDGGVTFMHEGDVTAFMAIVVRGRVALRLRVPERGAITILTLDPGDIVGWSAIVAPYRATTTATTLEPTDLAILDAAELRDLLATDTEVAAAFLPKVLETVVSRVAATRDQLLDLFHATGLDPW
ncbi:MAG: cyclic nucleotide-binding domain-containing protein [Chloroflexi bacterium]|nr:cyclic nucleotide-binding domain-containing protein [Chloroflexota bacterium]